MTIRPIIITTLVLVIFGYAAFESRNIARGPIIEIFEPSSGTTVTTDIVTIRGIVKNISGFTINGRSGAIDDTGAFEEDLVLLEGKNMIMIQAKDRFNRQTERLIELIYEETDEVVTR